MSNPDATINLKPGCGLCGVYALFLNGKAIWVGSSANIFSRIASHYRKAFDRVDVYWSTPENKSKDEANLIRRLQPGLNISQKKMTAADSNGEIDWRMLRDIDVARKIGCSREYARQIRKLFNHPDCFAKHRGKKFMQFSEAVKGSTKINLSELDTFTTSKQSAGKWCHILGVELVADVNHHPQKYPWNIVNWSLPCREIARIYSVKSETSVHRKRKRLGFPIPKLRVDRRSDQPEIVRLSNLETQKLREWKLKHPPSEIKTPATITT